MVRQENIETESTATGIIPASTSNSDYNSAVIITQNNPPQLISSELTNLGIINILQKAKNLANDQQPAITPQEAPKKPIDVIMAEANQLQMEKNGSDTSTRSLSGHIQGQQEGQQQCIAAQRVPDLCRSVEKLHEFLPDCEKIPGPSQHWQVTQWMASIDVKEKNDAFNSRMAEKQPPTTQESAKKSPSSQQQQLQCEKAATSSEQGQRQSTSPRTLQPGLQNPKDSAGCHGKCISDGQKNDVISEKGGSHIKISEIISDILSGIPNFYIAINDVKNHISDKNSSICNNIKTNNSSLSQINETFMSFKKN
ncbi:hypothetical protein O181_098348 [Austropuccinia psidii MF-1]|uniref:Uncharacterized protein n=1 Tax=Austropuccinia psidii MF-1 TaxID=1389203 RepID=A0A9Q3PE23_9BASI|nr:hypothetical protein [Austropuccinia psidii MF-1]